MQVMIVSSGAAQPETDNRSRSAARPARTDRMGRRCDASKRPYGSSGAGSFPRDTRPGASEPAYASMPPSNATCARPGGTPGRATRIQTSPPLSTTSIGGCQLGPATRAGPGSKNCRCRRSACSSISRACAHIQVRGSRDCIGSFPLDRLRPSSAHVSGYQGRGGDFKARREPPRPTAEDTVHRHGREDTRRIAGAGFAFSGLGPRASRPPRERKPHPTPRPAARNRTPPARWSCRRAGA